MAYHQPRYRGSLDRGYSLDAALAAAAYSEGAEAVTTAADSPPRGTSADAKAPETPEPRSSSDAMPPPPTPSETLSARPGRSTSVASRNANRLSLTLPIAQPNSIPSRPTPTASVPQTPVETPTISSPADPNEFIIAIAAQERRVLELREELKNAEGELTQLKSRYTSSDSYRKRASVRRPESLGPAAPITPRQNGRKERSSTRGNPDMDRRKAMLLAQSQGSPRETKRTVMQGGHARALSLLSPTKPAEDIQVLADPDVLRSPESYDQPTFDSRPAMLNKRATWAPRQQQAQPPGVKQMANDFRQGLWTFVEDLRQATVGEEGISGTSSRTDSAGRLIRTNSDHDTIRASSSNRGRIPFPAEASGSGSNSTSPASSLSRSNSVSFNERLQHRRTASRPEPKARKHFSWTPLTLDQCNDDDWSNWDSPNVKTSRWSGSTVNGDIIPAIPEKADENEGSLRTQRSRSELRNESESPSRSPKLEEMPQALLNRLAPGKLKKSAGEFIKEWERSLSSPPESPSLELAIGSAYFSDREA